MCSQHCASALGCARQTDRYLHSTARVRHHDRERELYTRDTSVDLFISELWRLLDEYEVLKHQGFFSPPLSIGQESRKQERIKVLNHVNKEYRKGKRSLIPFLPPCMFWFINNIPRAMWSVHLGKIKPVRLPLLYLYLKMWNGYEQCVNLNSKPFFTPLRTYIPVCKKCKTLFIAWV